MSFKRFVYYFSTLRIRKMPPVSRWRHSYF
nr:MAG TPA: hypothetical protein [Caudoviricetes sp.]